MTPPSDPFEKRLQRHLIGRERDFFAATAPGVGRAAAAEISRIPASLGNIREIPGGVTFSGKLPDAWAVNLHARITSRLLLRLAEFTALSFERLEARVAEIPWELIYYADTDPMLRSSTRKCRLYHTDGVAERVFNGLRRRLSETGTPSPEDAVTRIPQTVFVRGLRDRFTVSADTSGALLHIRGFKAPGEAPLRETLAAAVLELAGYRGDRPLLDPMCGSGAFTLEAVRIARRIPPGLRREFAFMAWPSFIPKRWANMVKTAEREMNTGPIPPVVASDLRRQAVSALKNTVTKADLGPNLRVLHRDFFALQRKDLPGPPGLVVLNPPYGKRLGSAEEGTSMLSEIWKKLFSDFRKWRAAVLTPEASAPDGFFSHRLVHGGLPVFLHAGRIP